MCIQRSGRLPSQPARGGGGAPATGERPTAATTHILVPSLSIYH